MHALNSKNSELGASTALLALGQGWDLIWRADRLGTLRRRARDSRRVSGIALHPEKALKG